MAAASGWAPGTQVTWMSPLASRTSKNSTPPWFLRMWDAM